MVHFMELVEILTKHGFTSLSDLQKFPPNPMRWSKSNWNFALDIIGMIRKKSRAELLASLKKPGDILLAFNASLRKLGLIVELEQISKLKDKDFAKELNKQPWAEEWVNR